MAVRETPSPHSHPPLSSPVGSRVRSEDAMPSPAPPAQPWSQVSVAPHTQTPLRDALPFESGPWAPLRCPTAGTSMSPLVPLVRPLGAWLELPRPSRWLLRTIRLGYAIQFARRPPKFRGNRFTSVLSQDALVLRAEVAGCPFSSGSQRRRSLSLPVLTLIFPALLPCLVRDSLCTALQTKILWINWSLNAIDTIETWVSGNLTALTERSQPAIRWRVGEVANRVSGGSFRGGH